jgi:transporter family-2 protein
MSTKKVGTMSYILLGVLAGAAFALQNSLNASLGKKAGYFGSVLLLTFISIGVLLILIAVFPKTATFRRAPGPEEWYLYTGGILGVIILSMPIFLIPRIGVTTTTAAIIVGQLVFAVVLDQIGFLEVPQISIDIRRVVGIVLLIAGVLLVKK